MRDSATPAIARHEGKVSGVFWGWMSLLWDD